ncbi:MAG: hypothetical protein D6737_15725 [Chloroflexi bacterium]|nr:MAG: hypothetical protein D6737_15725 [Chloroflexota bacterium]
MMQTVALDTTTTSEDSRPQQVVITLELLLYIALIVLALVLRFADLNDIPMTPAEAREALAAWRTVEPDAPGSTIIPQSPIIFLAQSITFSLLGGTELAARLLTALVGSALVLTPLLFRELLGRARALLLSALLTLSPVFLAASRYSSSMVWAVLVAVLMLWMLWRYWERGRSNDAIITVILAVSLVLLTDPFGFVMLLTLVGALLIAYNITPRPDDDDGEIANRVRERIRAVPWQFAITLTGLTVLLVSTIFLLHQSGLSAVGELLSVGASGIFNPATDSTPPLLSLATALFYEPVFWIFGFVALWLMYRRRTQSFIENFLAGWLLLATAASLYRGAQPDHAVWLILPLYALSSNWLSELFIDDRRAYWEIPWWTRPVLALVTVILLAILLLHLQVVGRFMLRVPEVTFQILMDEVPVSLLWMLAAVLFLIVGFFMAGGLWGNTTTLQGGALGLLIFGAIVGVSRGWVAAVPHSDDAREVWHTDATGRETIFLRETLLELADRESVGFPRIPIQVYAPDDGVVAWLMRDFVNATFIDDIADAFQQEIVLLAAPEGIAPELGGSYVGQDFVINRQWNASTMAPKDILTWVLQRDSRVPSQPTETMILWLRQDIYDGAPFINPASVTQKDASESDPDAESQDAVEAAG